MNKKILAGAAALVMTLGGAVCPAVSVFDNGITISVSADVVKNDGTFNYQVVHGGKSIQILGLVKASKTTANIPAEIDGLPVTEIGDKAFYNESHKAKKSLTKVTIPDSVVTIGDSAFAFNSALTSVKIPGSVKTIGANAFEGCVKLAKAELNEGLETIGDAAFYGCDHLPSLTLPASVKKIGKSISYECGTADKSKADFFFYCYSNTAGEYYAFDNHIAYELLDPDNALTSLVDNGIYNKQFRYKIINGGKEIRVTAARLAAGEINVPAKIGGLPVTEIGENAFYNPEHETINDLKKVTLPDTIRTIGKGAFADNEELTVINIPKSVKTIGEAAFEVCKKLEKIDLPEGLQTIGAQAFTWCQSLTTVTIPASVTQIGENAFFNCGTITGNANFFIYCTKGTAGEKYAKENKIEYSAKAPSKTSKGDLNGDGSVNVADLSKLAAHIKGKKMLSDTTAADFNSDGKTDVTDLSKLAAFIKGKKSL